MKAATMFCCGFPVSLGVWLILAFHLLACIGYLYAAWLNVVFHMTSFGSSMSSSAQMYWTVLCMMGVAIIIAAMYGTYKRIEVNVRVYLYYFLLCFVVDTVSVVSAFLLKDACQTSGNMLKLLAKNFGQAFMCGAMRIASYGAVISVVAVEAYCLYIVWSFCEDIHEGTNGFALFHMMLGKEDIWKKKHIPKGSDVPYAHADVVGIAHQKTPGPYPSPYGATQSQTSALVSHSLFGGQNHEMDYPPKGLVV